jgi:hypothetical protein
VIVNGLGQSWIPYGGVHTALGALPTLLHPSPKKVAVIGLGSGDTLFSVGGRADVEEVVAFELVGPQLDSLRRLQGGRPYGGLASLLSDDRFEIVVADGRTGLMRRAERFDIIEADAIRPYGAYAGNLYSVEYFRLVKAHLEPGGFAVTWCPTERIFRSFSQVFPELLYIDEVLIGSEQPIDYDPEALLRRARRPFTRQYFDEAGVDIVRLFAGQRSDVRTEAPAESPSRAADVNLDLFPRDEYLVPAY